MKVYEPFFIALIIIVVYRIVSKRQQTYNNNKVARVSQLKDDK